MYSILTTSSLVIAALLVLVLGVSIRADERGRNHILVNVYVVINSNMGNTNYVLMLIGTQYPKVLKQCKSNSCIPTWRCLCVPIFRKLYLHLISSRLALCRQFTRAHYTNRITYTLPHARATIWIKILYSNLCKFEVTVWALNFTLLMAICHNFCWKYQTYSTAETLCVWENVFAIRLRTHAYVHNEYAMHVRDCRPHCEHFINTTFIKPYAYMFTKFTIIMSYFIRYFCLVSVAFRSVSTHTGTRLVFLLLWRRYSFMHIWVYFFVQVVMDELEHTYASCGRVHARLGRCVTVDKLNVADVAVLAVIRACSAVFIHSSARDIKTRTL